MISTRKSSTAEACLDQRMVCVSAKCSYQPAPKNLKKEIQFSKLKRSLVQKGWITAQINNMNMPRPL